MLESSYSNCQFEAGTDEAGRGCLAGPVVAAAVIFPKGYTNDLLNDSKKLTKKQRLLFREQIQKDALTYAIAEVNHKEIDEINILQASLLAMHRALDKLKIRPEFVIVDGNKFNPYQKTPHECIIKGDGKYLSIAAASILAKTHRDEKMERLAKDYPHYSWHTNAGYPTKAHREGIRKHGVTPYHRLTFRLL
jgi:ribonuclease HII